MKIKSNQIKSKVWVIPSFQKNIPTFFLSLFKEKSGRIKPVDPGSSVGTS